MTLVPKFRGLTSEPSGRAKTRSSSLYPAPRSLRSCPCLSRCSFKIVTRGLGSVIVRALPFFGDLKKRPRDCVRAREEAIVTVPASRFKQAHLRARTSPRRAPVYTEKHTAGWNQLSAVQAAASDSPRRRVACRFQESRSLALVQRDWLGSDRLWQFLRFDKGRHVTRDVFAPESEVQNVPKQIVQVANRTP
jgi:hypothetical protein